MQFIFNAFVTSVAGFEGQATLDLLNNSTVPIFYTGLCTQPSTGKTGAMKFVQSAVESVERYFMVPDTKSIQVNAPTIEGFLEIMREIPEVSGMY